MSIQSIAPLRVGIVGTGYAANKRAEALIAEPRTQLVAASGNIPARVQQFCSKYEIQSLDSWKKLIDMSELDLIFICTINRDSGAIARAAIEAEKHVVVEYPLALKASEAQEIINLSEVKQKLLHIEHMELLGGIHQAVKQYLPEIGEVFQARYTTINSQQSVLGSWKYHRQMFGFPLAAALSRIHRLTDLFGNVHTVTCTNRYWDIPDTDYFRACFCHAQLNFQSGAIAQVTYGKGDVFFNNQRTLEIYGEHGSMIFEGEQGTLIQSGSQTPIAVKPRRGLFALDTSMVLDYLFEQQPLYIDPKDSLYALAVANAAEDAAKLGDFVVVSTI